MITSIYFKELNNSYPTEKNIKMRPVVNAYRRELTRVLLEAGESIILDGSSFTRELRKRCFDLVRTEAPQIKIIIVWAKLSEPELLKRLAERDKTSGARWVDMYHDYRKPEFEPPEADEADMLLVYNQENHAEIERGISQLI